MELKYQATLGVMSEQQRSKGMGRLWRKLDMTFLYGRNKPKKDNEYLHHIPYRSILKHCRKNKSQEWKGVKAPVGPNMDVE